MSLNATYADEGDIKKTEIFFSNLNNSNIQQIRGEIYKSINGDSFFPIHTWPLDMQLLFTNLPLSDSDTFKLILFMFGNGCPPQICIQHILCSHFNKNAMKTIKRIHQIRWITTNLEHKLNTWYYFDIFENKMLSLSGIPRGSL